jgi:hypothetical protein
MFSILERITTMTATYSKRSRTYRNQPSVQLERRVNEQLLVAQQLREKLYTEIMERASPEVKEMFFAYESLCLAQKMFVAFMPHEWNISSHERLTYLLGSNKEAAKLIKQDIASQPVTQPAKLNRAQSRSRRRENVPMLKAA